MVATWGESSDEESESEDGYEQALMEIEEYNEESEVSIIHLKDKINFLSKERLSELLLDFIDESKDLNNKKEQLSKESVILKAKCKNLELRASESERSKNQFLSLEDLEGGNVSFGNGKNGEIIGFGKVDKTDSHSIENVYLIDCLKYSLISVLQLCDRGKKE
ncbi:uncharacterized protein [Nicotiana sylvestris]|uniref:uncharacterized protein n=1 Tax=Nicotiana sylvestris TaxID=4096 RepID=UPI00388CC96B